VYVWCVLCCVLCVVWCVVWCVLCVVCVVCSVCVSVNRHHHTYTTTISGQPHWRCMKCVLTNPCTSAFLLVCVAWSLDLHVCVCVCVCVVRAVA